MTSHMSVFLNICEVLKVELNFEGDDVNDCLKTLIVVKVRG